MESTSSFITQDAIITATTVGFIFMSGYYYLKTKYSYWHQRGIKGPKAIPLVGNLLSLFSQKRRYYEREWLKKYGDVYGVYWGTKPALVCANPNLLIQICIKDFDSFTDHQIIDFMNKYAKVFLFGSRGDDWKRLRFLMTPTFTKAKIKRMFKLMDDCVDDLIKCIKEQNERISKSNKPTIDTSDAYNLYALDTISSCCYSLKLKRDGMSDLKSIAKNDKFLADMLKVFDISVLKFVALFCTPKFIVNYFNLQVQPDSEIEPMIEKISKMLDARRERINDNAKRKFDDYLQTLVDARIENDSIEKNKSKIQSNNNNNYSQEIISTSEEVEDHHAILSCELSKKAQDELNKQVVDDVSKTKKNIQMTDIEIGACTIFLLAVGVHTTSVLLSNLTYLLAHHKDIQQKLYKDLISIVEIKRDEERGTESYSFNYDSITECHYLDAIVSESLRLYPPAFQSDRIATKDYYIDSLNLHVPQNSIILLSIYSLQNNPKYWSKPELFNPNRFMPGNKENIVPGSYCPFGIGPRNCIGMRFSLTETKLAVAKILMNFVIEPVPNTTYSTEVKFGAGFLARIKNPSVCYVERKKQNN